MSNYEHAARLADQQADAQALALLAVVDAIRERTAAQTPDAGDIFLPTE